MPIGVPQVVGSPTGGPMSGLIPRGGAIIPGGGVARPTDGGRGSPPSSWILLLGAPAVLAVAAPAAAATVPLPCGVTTCWDDSSIPWTEPAVPAGT